MCSVPQAVTLYKNPLSPEVVGTRATGQAFVFTVERVDHNVDFYCDVDGWLTDVESRHVSFNIQCKLCGTYDFSLDSY